MLAKVVPIETSIAIFQTRASMPLGLSVPRYSVLLLRMKKAMKAIGSMSPQTAEVGIAIQGPTYFQSTTPATPGAGIRQASL
jgi:hypothetical protein